jgi:uncharacterized protein (DUF302 family)
MIRTDGNGSARAAADRLVAAIDGNDKINVVARVEHSAAAAKVGLELEPTVEIIFGNPALGTPLMQISRTVAIDLPQKILITEIGGALAVFHNDPVYLAERHGIPADTPQLGVVGVVLQALANAAAGV